MVVSIVKVSESEHTEQVFYLFNVPLENILTNYIERLDVFRSDDVTK